MSTNHLRKYSRLPFLAEALIEVGGKSASVHILDISLKGALITRPESTLPLDDGPFTLSIRLSDDGAAIAMQAVMRHQESGHVGCEWVGIDIDSMTHLRRLLELNLADPALVERELHHLQHH